MARAIINGNRSRGTISRNIYGHFSEHLGRCIYDGLYVGEQSGIPNVSGMRTDVVEALRAMGIPLLRWPGRPAADKVGTVGTVLRRDDGTGEEDGVGLYIKKMRR